MDALAVERVEVGRQRRDEGLALAGPHLGDLATVQHDSADQLDVIMALAERAPGRLADRGKRLRQDIVERLACLEPLAEADGLAGKLLVGHRADVGFEAR